MSSLDRKMTDAGSSVYYEPDFRHLLEDHIGRIRATGQLQTRVVSAQLAYKYERNFYGLLQELGVPREHQWVVLRLNGFKDPGEVTSDITSVTLPDFARVETLAKTYRARRTVL